MENFKKPESIENLISAERQKFSSNTEGLRQKVNGSEGFDLIKRIIAGLAVPAGIAGAILGVVLQDPAYIATGLGGVVSGAKLLGWLDKKP